MSLRLTSFIVSMLLIVVAAGLFFSSQKNAEPDGQHPPTDKVLHPPSSPAANAQASNTTSSEPTISPKTAIDPRYTNTRLLTLSQPTDQKWWNNAVIYQIWPRSFYDENGDGNGDFKGLKQKLDYIASLGVDAIWLTPVFESPSYHGYDAANFYQIESDFGTMEDFDAFIAAAKAKGIKVILDLVVNHVSEHHSWFQKALQKDPTYSDYFVWQKELPENYGRAWGNEIDPTLVWHKKAQRDEYYYGAFGWTQPDLNFNNPKVVEEIKKVASFWLNKGVDGFRLDAIRYLIESDGIEGQADTQGTIDFWSEFSAHVKSANKDALLVGEALTETDKIGAYYNQGKGLDAAFDFGFNYVAQGALEVVDNPPPLARDRIGKSIRNNIWNTFAHRYANPDVPGNFYHTFINNHDHDRLNVFLEDDIGRAKIAASILLLAPGTRYIYYGEEVGVTQQHRGDDMFRRGLMQWDNSDNAGFNSTNNRWLDNSDWFFWIENFDPWWEAYWQDNRAKHHVAAQEKDTDSLLSFYKALIKLRKEDDALNMPDTMELYSNTEMVWMVKYSKGAENRWILLNLDANQDSSFVLPNFLSGELTDTFQQKKVRFENDEVVLAPGELMILTH